MKKTKDGQKADRESFRRKPKLVSSLSEDMMERLRDRLPIYCNVIEIKNNEVIQSFLVERS